MNVPVASAEGTTLLISVSDAMNDSDASIDENNSKQPAIGSNNIAISLSVTVRKQGVKYLPSLKVDKYPEIIETRRDEPIHKMKCPNIFIDQPYRFLL